MNARRRHGFSLLEVLLAASILIGSSIVLLELVTIGNRHATSARDLARSQLLCQSKLDEVLCGILPPEPVRPTPFESDPQWVYWIELLPLEKPGLAALEVNVAYEPGPQKQSARFTLVRWIRDPRQMEKSSPGDRPEDAPAQESNLARGGLLP